MIPRSVRNSNPGNLRKSAQTWIGEVPGEDLSFATFDTADNGFRALAKVLLAYKRIHGLDTVSKIITRYAPSHENDTDAYIVHVCQVLGVRPNDYIDVEDATTLVKLVSAIARHEAGADVWADSSINNGVTRALA